ncbi:MAG: hypothetical protein WA941_00040 [Nitrososphaeraceae archaeon]
MTIWLLRQEMLKKKSDEEIELEFEGINYRFLSLRMVMWYHDVEIVELEQQAQQHGSIC